MAPNNWRVKIICAALFVLLALAAIWASSSHGQTLALGRLESAAVGEIATIPVQLDTQGKALHGVELNVLYRPINAMLVLGAVSGELTNQCTVKVGPLNPHGRIRLALMCATGVIGKGVMANIKVVAKKPGGARFDLIGCSADERLVPCRSRRVLIVR